MFDDWLSFAALPLGNFQLSTEYRNYPITTDLTNLWAYQENEDGNEQNINDVTSWP